MKPAICSVYSPSSLDQAITTLGPILLNQTANNAKHEATILNIVSQFKPQVWNESKEFEISKIYNFWQIKITLQTINSLLSKYMLYPWILNR